MSLATKIAAYHATLVDIRSRVGIPADKLRSKEDAAGIGCDHPDADLKKLDTICQADLDRWFRVLGTSLEIFFVGSADHLDGPAEWTATVEDHDVAELEKMLYQVRQGYNSSIDITVNVIKSGSGYLVDELRQGARKRCPEVDGLLVLLFFSRDRLIEILSRHDHASLEDQFFEPDGPGVKPTLTLIADKAGKVLGPWLGFLGVGHHDEDELCKFAISPRDHACLLHARSAMGEHVNWDGRPAVLTPAHLITAAPDADDVEELEACRGQVVRLQNRLVVPYLANRTIGEDNRLETTFIGKRSLTIRVEDESASTALYELYAWAYRAPAEVPTRLEIVRRVVASEITEDSLGFEQLIDRSKRLLEECDVQLRLLIDDNLAESFERRQQIAQVARAYADEVGDRIQALTKEVVDNTYKTVGLLVGVVFAYLLRPDQGALVLTCGLAVAVGYVAFVRAFYVGSIRQEFEAGRTAFGDDRKRIEREGLVVTEGLFDSVGKRESAFDRRLGHVNLVYGVVLGIALLGAFIWWFILRPAPGPETVRRHALQDQASLFEGFGYVDIRVNLPGAIPPERWSDPQTGETVVPDLTATRSDRSFVAVAYVPCAAIEVSSTIDQISAILRLAPRYAAEVEILTDAVCEKTTGEERLRAWLARDDLPDLRIWTR